MSAILIEIQNGVSAPTGSTMVWHNGRQYAVLDGIYSGSTYIPSVPMPGTPVMDLTPVMSSIASLQTSLQMLSNAQQMLSGEIANIKSRIDEIDGNASEKVEAAWNEFKNSVEERFDDIDRALRLAVGE